MTNAAVTANVIDTGDSYDRDNVNVGVRGVNIFFPTGTTMDMLVIPSMALQRILYHTPFLYGSGSQVCRL